MVSTNKIAGILYFTLKMCYVIVYNNKIKGFFRNKILLFAKSKFCNDSSIVYKYNRS